MIGRECSYGAIPESFNCGFVVKVNKKKNLNFDLVGAHFYCFLKCES